MVPVALLAGASPQPQQRAPLRFAVSFPAASSAEPLDGRVLLMISSDPATEPRFQISDAQSTQLMFGIDVEGLRPGQEAMVDASALGYPVRSLAEIPPGRYRVQALLNRYETFRRSDGHVVKLPPDKGEGQAWNRKPGNLYSTPREMEVDARKNEVVRITLDQEIPPIPDPPETKYIRHERIQSRLLSEFWGRPMYVGAHVLLPEGFAEHPDARYPLVINHGHFPYTFGGFSETPADTTTPCEYSERFSLDCYNHVQERYAHQFYRDWTGPGFPRVLLIEIQHATPYYDDSYAVNSANNGPYGDAIMQELIPHIERKYRGIGQGYARFTYGGSTGGWEAMAVQVFYPDQFNGAWVACPDPIDFRAYTVVNIYDDKNAYHYDSQWKRTPRPGFRNWLGQVRSTLEEMNRRELVLGSKGRSGDQWDIWQAVYSPAGPDGYPKPIWNKLTGEIDPTVAAYWRENYDLSYILRRDWKTLGPKLKGKLFIYVGDMDNYYLNNAVYLTEEFLESTTDPFYAGEVDYGDRAEHCWNGDHTRANAYSRLRYHQMFIPRIMDQIRKNHPASPDTVSWRY
ncbi:MAG: hypothetical protein A2W29_00660 [Gemmatimonadetes bacterium RBG_16_66_8]|nr:MAG: hypothetical protein A2W29_00660 [Gemmatimonadetes bacterium RBG_16_66_8]